MFQEQDLCSKVNYEVEDQGMSFAIHLFIYACRVVITSSFSSLLAM